MLADDGSLLAACVNAASLALVDAGVPMRGWLAACTVGSVDCEGGVGAANTFVYNNDDGSRGRGQSNTAAEPLIDTNALEEQEVPFLTLATCAGVNSTRRTRITGGATAATVDPDAMDEDDSDSSNNDDEGDTNRGDGRPARRGVAVQKADTRGHKINMLMLETRLPVERLEVMLDVGVRACDEVRRKLDAVVRRAGDKYLG